MKTLTSILRFFAKRDIKKKRGNVRPDRISSLEIGMTVQPPPVALLVETSTFYGRQILAGIARFLLGRQPWMIFLEQRELRSMPPSWLRRQKWRGVISRVADRRLAEHFHRMSIPVVDLNDLYDDMGFPQILSDNRLIGRLGAEHLRERGYRHFSFCDFSGESWATERRDGFVAAVRGMGFTPSVFASPWRRPDAPTWERDLRDIGRWIKSLPRPTAIMACNDVRGQHVLTVCATEGISVPEDVAVLGVDNEEIFCALCSPPLSSVEPDPERIGYEAAALLEKMMRGAPPPQRQVRIPPIRVVPRKSTEVMAIEDPATVTALKYIRAHALEGCTLREVMRQARLSRSSLEYRFRKHLGYTPRQAIRSVQLQRARQLLSESDLPLWRIADLTGFEHAEYFNVLFKREIGQTPGAYRREHRA